MTDTNVVILCGRLTRDAELRYLDGGSAICKFAVAVNRSVKKGDRWEDEGNFFDCVWFGKRAESCAQYLTKGQQVVVEGSLKQDRWEKDGQHREKVTIAVDNVQLVGSKPQDKPQSQPRGDIGYGTKAPSKPQMPPEPDQFNDDIPF